MTPLKTNTQPPDDMGPWEQKAEAQAVSQAAWNASVMLPWKQKAEAQAEWNGRKQKIFWRCFLALSCLVWLGGVLLLSLGARQAAPKGHDGDLTHCQGSTNTTGPIPPCPTGESPPPASASDSSDCSTKVKRMAALFGVGGVMVATGANWLVLCLCVVLRPYMRLRAGGGGIANFSKKLLRGCEVVAQCLPGCRKKP